MQYCCPPSDKLTVPQASKSILSGLYSDLEMQSKCILKTDIMDGAVSNLFPPHSFMYADSASGLVQSFIIVNELEWKFDNTLWRYKIAAWSSQAKKLNVAENKTYRFMQCKLKPYTTKKKKLPRTNRNLKCIYLHFRLLSNSLPQLCEKAHCRFFCYC